MLEAKADFLFYKSGENDSASKFKHFLHERAMGLSPVIIDASSYIILASYPTCA
jgi:hypothetical protein